MGSVETYTLLSGFCGSGGGALGFIQAAVALNGRELRFRSLGGIDNDPLACEDFEYLTKSPALCADVSKLTATELRAFVGHIPPDAVFGSAPCKGFSGLLSTKASKHPRYQAMNRLAFDWLELVLTAWDVPPKLILFENVPRVMSRGKSMLDKMKRRLREAGYVLHDQAHDCGVLGGLAQHRQRYLLVARHAKRCPPLLYQPPPQRVKACGEVLGPMPLPEDPAAGPMHRLPRLSWLNWVRLSLIPAGGDWRDLEGTLRDGQPRREVHRRHRIEKWDEPSATITGSGSGGVGNVADPRIDGGFGAGTHSNVMRVTSWTEPVGAVTSANKPSSGAGVVANPRFGNVDRVTSWNSPVQTITSSPAPSSGAGAVADPRVSLVPRGGAYDHGYGVLRFDEPSSTIAGGTDVGQGAYAVADVRFGGTYYSGTYGVLGWEEAAGTITGNARIDTGRFAVADPRKPPPAIRIIIAADGTWHRPLTILEKAALQGLPTIVDGAPLKLAGEAMGKWSERIGNLVPPPAACAIAEQMLVCLASGKAGSWSLSSGGSVWVERATRRRQPEAQVTA